MAFKNFVKELNGNRVEGELLITMFYSLLTSFIFLFIAYYLKLKTIESIIPKYGFYLFFSALSYAIITPAIRQVRAYKEFPCMSGMMIGMTSVMLLNDHLKTAGILIFIISSIIMIKLNYMVYNETKETEREKKDDHLFTIIFTIVLISITTWIIIYGPRGGIFQ